MYLELRLTSLGIQKTKSNTAKHLSTRTEAVGHVRLKLASKFVVFILYTTTLLIQQRMTHYLGTKDRERCCWYGAQRCWEEVGIAAILCLSLSPDVTDVCIVVAYSFAPLVEKRLHLIAVEGPKRLRSA